MKRISTILALALAAALIAAVYVGVLYFGEDVSPTGRRGSRSASSPART